MYIPIVKKYYSSGYYYNFFSWARWFAQISNQSNIFARKPSYGRGEVREVFGKILADTNELHTFFIPHPWNNDKRNNRIQLVKHFCLSNIREYLTAVSRGDTVNVSDAYEYVY